MTEHDENRQDPTPADPLDPAPVEPAAAQPVEPAPAAFAAAPPPPPVEPRTRWRDRVFRARSVAAVAVAGVILGAAGGAVTTALVSDHDGDRHERPGFGQMVPPGGTPGMMRDREGFPVPPGSDGDPDSDSDSSTQG